MNKEIYLRKFKDYLLSEGRSTETIKSYVRSVEQFIEITRKKDPSAINKKDIEKYKYWCNEIKHYDKNTLIPKYCAIKIFVEHLEIPEKEIKTFKLAPPRPEIKPKTPLTREEIKHMFEASQENLRDNAILKTLYYTTLRNRELCSLNIDDVDHQRQKIRNRGKGGHYDERNIHPDCLKAIRDYLELREDSKEGHEQALFLNNHGVRIGKTFLHYMVKKYAYLARIDKRVYPHLFRASSITHMAEAGATIPEIMAQSRHRSVDTLIKHYICPTEEHNKEVYLKTLSFNKKPEPEHKQDNPEPEKPPKVQTTQTLQETPNKEDRYIQLLKDGLIDKDDFMQLMLTLKKTDSNPLYG